MRTILIPVVANFLLGGCAGAGGLLARGTVSAAASETALIAGRAGGVRVGLSSSLEGLAVIRGVLSEWLTRLLFSEQASQRE